MEKNTTNTVTQRLADLARNKRMFRATNVRTGEAFYGQVLSVGAKSLKYQVPARSGTASRRILLKNFAFAV